MSSEPVYQRPATPTTPTGQPVWPVPQSGQPVRSTAPTAVAPVPRSNAAGLAARIVLTLLGAAGMIVGAFLQWIRTPGTRLGTDLSARILWQTNGDHTRHFVLSAGFVLIVLGLLAIVGLAFRSGWLTRLAGALGIVALILFGITLYRSPVLHIPSSVGAGAWLGLAGALVATIGGFLGTRHRVAITTPAGVTTATETAA
jgi:hypothetical protein